LINLIFDKPDFPEKGCLKEEAGNNPEFGHLYVFSLFWRASFCRFLFLGQNLHKP
jgi:hypothetical protein